MMLLQFYLTTLTLSRSLLLHGKFKTHTRSHLLFLLCILDFGTIFDKRMKEACSEERTGKQEMNNNHVACINPLQSGECKELDAQIQQNIFWSAWVAGFSDLSIYGIPAVYLQNKDGEQQDRYIVVCTSSRRLYGVQHKHAVSYIFRLVDRGKKGTKLNNEYLWGLFLLSHKHIHYSV